jgi:hypothetical protein
MPHKPHVRAWKPLLRVAGFMATWRWESVAILIVGLEPEDAAGYVPLSNIYVARNWHLQEAENMVIAVPRKPRVVRG